MLRSISSCPSYTINPVNSAEGAWIWGEKKGPILRGERKSVVPGTVQRSLLLASTFPSPSFSWFPDAKALRLRAPPSLQARCSPRSAHEAQRDTWGRSQVLLLLQMGTWAACRAGDECHKGQWGHSPRPCPAQGSVLAAPLSFPLTPQLPARGV